MALRRWVRRTGRIWPLVLIAGLALVIGWSFALSWRPSATNYPFQGLDVDETRGPIDWWTVRADGADFAYVRATMGSTGRDTRFAANWSDVYATGMRRGALHVYSICNLAADQANNFNTTVPRDRDALPAAVVLDFTEGCDSRPEQRIVIDELRRFMTMVEEHTGKPVLMKLSRRFDATYQISAAIPRPVWAVQDFFPPDYAARPWRMWQANDMRRIEGVSGPVNWDVVAP